MIAEFLTLLEEEYGGMRKHYFFDQCTSGMRIGQAFMNALRGTPYYEQLTGTIHDPFYSTRSPDVFAAIDFLTTK